MFNAFYRANPQLSNMIAAELYGKAYQDLSPNEKSAADAKINEYYKIYKTSTVR